MIEKINKNHIITTIKPFKNLIHYIFLFAAITFLFINKNELIICISNMSVAMKIMYLIAIIIYSLHYIMFWEIELKGEHMTYGYININKQLIIQRNDILYSIILLMLNYNINLQILLILSLILIIKSIIIQPLIFRFLLEIDE